MYSLLTFAPIECVVFMSDACFVMWFLVSFLVQHHLTQSELPLPILGNSVESDHGCTSRIYFDNVDDNVTLTLYNVTLASHKPC